MSRPRERASASNQIRAQRLGYVGWDIRIPEGERAISDQVSCHFDSDLLRPTRRVDLPRLRNILCNGLRSICCTPWIEAYHHHIGDIHLIGLLRIPSLRARRAHVLGFLAPRMLASGFNTLRVQTEQNERRFNLP